MDPFNINHLKPDEFLIECSVRKLTGNPLENLENLKLLIKGELDNPILRPVKPHIQASKNPDREIRKCQIKIYELRQNFIDLEDETLDEENNQDSIMSRIMHVIRRLERLSSATRRYKTQCLQVLKEAQAFQKYMKDYVNKTSSFANIVETIEKDNNTGIEELSSSGEELSDDESVISNQTVAFAAQEQNIFRNKCDIASSSQALSKTMSAQGINLKLDNEYSNQINLDMANLNIHAQSYPDLPNMRYQNQSAKTSQPLPIYQTQPTIHLSSSDHKIKLAFWKIDFDGSSDGLPIERFLFRVEHLARTHRVTENELKDQFGVLLKGSALNWYWCYLERNPNLTWSQLRNAIIERFQDRRTDDDIRRILDSRKQKSGETFMEFYNEILSLSLRFRNPISDADILRTLRYNMSIGLQNHLADQEIDSISTLVRRCVALEDMWKRHQFNPEKFCKPIFQVHEISNNNTSQTHSNDINSDQNSSNNINRSVNNNLNSNSNQPNYYICWNCQDIGHSFLKCNKPRRLFCHGCGNNGFYKQNCPKCNTSGNGQLRTSKTAMDVPHTNQNRQQFPRDH